MWGGLGHSYAIHVDPTFSPDEQQEILTAAAIWENAAPVDFTIDNAPCDSVRPGEICVRLLDDAAFASKNPPPSEPGTTLLAFTQYRSDAEGFRIDGAEVFFRIDAIDGNFRTVVAHELGHAMGLGHSEPGTLMAPMVNDDAPMPTCVDLGHWAELRGLHVRCVRNK